MPTMHHAPIMLGAWWVRSLGKAITSGTLNLCGGRRQSEKLRIVTTHVHLPIYWNVPGCTRGQSQNGRAAIRRKFGVDGIWAIIVASDASQVCKGNSKEDSKASGEKTAHPSGLWTYARHATRLKIKRSLSRKNAKHECEKNETVSVGAFQRMVVSNAQNKSWALYPCARTRFPNPRIKIVHQFHKMEFGKGAVASMLNN
jgi:hypothetical protein